VARSADAGFSLDADAPPVLARVAPLAIERRRIHIMTSREHVVGRNILIALGLWWSFSLLGSLVIWAWNWAFVYNRVFTGPSGDAIRLGLSLPGYVISGTLVGIGVAWFIESSHAIVWATSLGALVAAADFRSFNTMRYRGRSLVDAEMTALAIVGSIVFGCWLGLRMKARHKPGDVE